MLARLVHSARPPSSSRPVAVQPPHSSSACAPRRRRGGLARVRAAATPAAATHQLVFHLGETTIQVPCSPEQVRALDAALSKLLQTFADKQAAARPQRWESMEVRFKGEAEAGPGLELVELLCNPNSFKTAFDAKLVLSVRAVGGLRVTCEGRLSNVKADVDAYLADL